MLSLSAKSKITKKFSGKIFSNFQLKNKLYYQIGGPADIFIAPSSVEDIRLVVNLAWNESVPLTLLGAGTNLLVRDGGIRGVVLFLGYGLGGSPKILNENFQGALVSVPSFFAKAHLLQWAYENKLGGLEFSAGIPGTLGGAVWMNAGTKWGSYSDVIESVGFFHPEHGAFRKQKEDLGLKYRGHGEGLLDAWTVVEDIQVILPKLSVEKLEESQKKIDEILSYRGLRQPLERPSCGSVFKNPETSEKGAGRMIEACGLKGLKMGDAQVSTKHANFILNLGQAKASDVEGLIKKIQAEVFEKFQIQLEPEVIILGQQ